MLLLRPDHIGDVLLTAPAVALLRASLPDAHLTYLVGPWSAEAARRGPSLDEVRTLAYPGFTPRRNSNLAAPYALLAREAVRLRRERYDLAIVFRPDHWWGALLAEAAGIPLRVGSLTPETAPLLTHTYAARTEEHAAERSLAVARLALEAVGVTTTNPTDARPFTVSDAARAETDAFWRRNGLPGKRVVALHPSAGAPLKSWPLHNWAHLADELLKSDLRVLLVGAPSDGPLLSAIAERMTAEGVILACGQSLDVSAALYQRCDVAVTVDSGAGHLAAAVGTPTVRLYGPASSSIYGPWPSRPDQRVLIAEHLACVPCGNLQAPPCGARSLPACMLAVSVHDVEHAVMAQLEHG